jgi:hypothetical protein
MPVLFLRFDEVNKREFKKSRGKIYFYWVPNIRALSLFKVKRKIFYFK